MEELMYQSNKSEISLQGSLHIYASSCSLHCLAVIRLPTVAEQPRRLGPQWRFVEWSIIVTVSTARCEAKGRDPSP